MGGGGAMDMAWSAGEDMNALTGGKSGDMENYWGDNNGSQMVMVNGGKIANAIMGGVVGITVVAGVTVWLINRA